MDPLSLALILGASNPSVQQGVGNVLGNLPIIGGIFGGGQSDAEKALIRKQQQMAESLKRRQQQMRLQAPQLQAGAQQMLAYDPLNQHMARTFGPESAFTPEQVTGMLKNPMPMPGIDEWARDQPGAQQGKLNMAQILGGDMSSAQPDTGSLVDYRGTDPEKQRLVEEYLRQKQMFDEAEARRKQTIEGGFRQPGPGPAPLAPRAAPQAVRRF